MCSALLSRNLIDKSWTLKPSVDTSANLANSGPMMSILVNGFQTTCILDTGPSFTLVPFQFWKQLQINQNKLNTAVHFNINSASHCNKDAVLGQIVLELTVSNINGDVQLINKIVSSFVLNLNYNLFC